MHPILKVLIVLLAIGLFIGSYLLNKKTKTPECDNIDLENCAKCSNALCKQNKTKEGNKDHEK